MGDLSPRPQLTPPGVRYCGQYKAYKAGGEKKAFKICVLSVFRRGGLCWYSVGGVRCLTGYSERFSAMKKKNRRARNAKVTSTKTYSSSTTPKAGTKPPRTPKIFLSLRSIFHQNAKVTSTKTYSSSTTPKAGTKPPRTPKIFLSLRSIFHQGDRHERENQERENQKGENRERLGILERPLGQIPLIVIRFPHFFPIPKK